METLTQARVLELFEDQNGQLIRKVKVAQRSKAGDIVGCPNTGGYLQVMIDGKMYIVHRVMFLLHHGSMPEHIDHIDCNAMNNHISNLREATASQNASNKPMRTDNKSGYKGVSWKASSGKWVSQIAVGRKKLHLGLFDDPKDAAIIYAVNALRHHGDFAKL